MLSGTSVYAGATAKECQATLNKFRALGNVPDLLAQSYGYAVLPTIGKGGIGIGGAGGTGRLFLLSPQAFRTWSNRNGSSPAPR